MNRRSNIFLLMLLVWLALFVSQGNLFAKNQQENSNESDEQENDYVENFMDNENTNQSNTNSQNANNQNENNNENNTENANANNQNNNNNSNSNFTNSNASDFNGANAGFDVPAGNVNPAAANLPGNNVPTQGIPPENNLMNEAEMEQASGSLTNGNPLPENIPTNNGGMGAFNAAPAANELNPATPLSPGEPTQAVDPVAIPETTPMAAPVAPAPTTDMTASSPAVDSAPDVQGTMQPSDFAGAPPIFGTKRLMAMGEAPEEYTVEPGDTLFDVCDQLIDEPNYWPKLWAMNPEIKNPHFIYPGMKLRFYPGDKETPPYLQVVMEDDVIPIDKGEIEEQELVKDVVPEDISGLLTSFGGADTTTMIGADELTGVDGVASAITVIGEPPRPGQVMVDVPAFIYEESKDPLGIVVGGVSGMTLIDKDEEVIVRNEEGVATGTTYTVLRPTETIHDAHGRYVGKRYDFVAHLRVTNKSDEGLLLGKVTENRLGVQPGDQLFAYRSTRRVVSTTGITPPTGGSGNSIVGFDNPEMVLGGKGSMVIFETASSKSISVGQTIAVFQDINKSASAFIIDSLPDTARNVAIVRIIDATGVGAVGYVLSNKREIRVGDRAGRG